MSIIVVTLSVFICHISSTDVMLQYEASEVTGDQMPDQVNVTFSTETKSLTKLNLRRSRHFNLDIPLYTLDTDQEGIFHRHKVKTRPKKDLGFYQDITNKAVFRIQRSSEKSAYKKSKFNLKGEFLLNTSKCLFDSEKKTLKKPWRNMPPKPIIAPPEEKTVRMNAINIRDMHMKSSGRKYNQSKLRSVPQSRRRRNTVQDYYVDVVAVIDYKRYSKFLAQANYNNFTAMQNILEYYALVFSGADMLYEGIKHPEYTIHILLSKVYVLQTVASSSFIDRDASYDEMNADTALHNLHAFNIGSGSSIVGIYDHVMLLTG
ncbi:ADAM family mig-17 [Biomphalaria glabrata]|nr:ADAM family mig-17 [Biomphalaria glabrata]